MKIINPEVTLQDDIRTGVNPEERKGFLDWLSRFVVEGDDGELYSISQTILSMDREQLDLVTLGWTKGKGIVKQLPNSIYKIGKYPGTTSDSNYDKHIPNPKGTLKITEEEDKAIISCGNELTIECYKDHTWHFIVDSGDGEYKADLYHRVDGFPLWYGREEPSLLTQHSVTYGYNWDGTVDGTIWIKDKEIKVKGAGIRERYVAIDSSAAELGGWEDWGSVTFNEIHSSMYDMRLGMKDFSIYDLENKKHYPEGNMTITHEDWVFLREFDGFIPTKYNIKIEVEDGIYEINAKVCNATTWGVTFKVPDMPVATLIFDEVEGTFTDKNGKIRKLTGGNGNMSIRQWHQYPNMLPRELYIDDNNEQTQNKYQTL